VEAARAALYHVELLRCVQSEWSQSQDQALDNDARHHLGNIRSLVRGINLDDPDQETYWQPQHEQFFHEEALGGRIVQRLPPRVAQKVSKFFLQHPEMASGWTEVLTSVNEVGHDGPLDKWKTQRIHAALMAFLSIARPPWQIAMDAVKTYRRKHLLISYGLPLLVLLIALVKPLRAMVMERPWFAFPSAAIQILTPWLLLKLWERRLYRSLSHPEKWRGGIGRLRIATFFWHPYTQYPAGTEPFVPGGDLLKRVLWARGLMEALYAIGIIAVSGIMWHATALFPSGAPIVVLLFLILALLLFALHAFDFLDWLEDLPLRYLAMLLSLALLLFCAVLNVPTGAMGVLIISVGALILLTAALPRYTSFPRLIRLPFGVLIALAATLVGGALIIANERSLADAWHDDADPRPLVQASAWPYHSPAASGDAPPILVAAASGGGSRAAYFTAKVLSALDELCPDGAKKCDEPMGRHLQAISSVSGGSLATATYVSSRYQGRPTSSLPRAMREDFLQSVMLGAISPREGRKDTLLRKWRGPGILNGNLTLGDLARRWKSHRGKTPPFPMPLINSSTLDSHMVVISPLAHKAYTDGLYEKARDQKPQPSGGEEATWVNFRSGTYGLDHLLPRRDPDLAEATLASANFPFGFPLVRLETTQPLVYSPMDRDREPGTRKNLFLTDGGVLSNSGFWSLYHLLVNAAEAHDSESPRSLQSRGVILLLIDVSKMPTYHGRSSDYDLYQAITDQAPLGDNIHRRMLELLDGKLGGGLRVIQIALAPNKTTNVYTSWALDRDSLDDLDVQWDAQWAPGAGGGIRDRLIKAWSDLRQGKPSDLDPGLEPRVPLD